VTEIKQQKLFLSRQGSWI